MSDVSTLPDVPSLSLQKHLYSKDYLIQSIQDTSDSIGKVVSRDRFRTETGIPDSAWVNIWGTFAEFQRAAGLKPSRYAQRLINQTALQASSDHLRDLNAERLTYGNKYIRDHGGRFRTIMACSDIHDIEVDPFFERVWMETLHQVQPDIAIVGGDLFDAAEFGKYPNDPREWDAVGRIQRGRKFLADTRENAPEAQIDLIEGNHEARILKHFAEASPALRAVLADIHGMSIASLLALDEFEVNYVAHTDLGRWSEREMNVEANPKNYKVYFDCVMAHHFPEGRKHGVPGFNGHHHKHVVWSEYNYSFGSYEWHQLGCGHKRSASYTDGLKWNMGFVIINIDTLTNRPYFDYVSVGDTMAVAGGTFYYRKDDEFYPALKNGLRMK